MPSQGKVVRGAVWRVVEIGGGEGISFVVFLVLARVLSPDVFGLVALAGIVLALSREVLLSGVGQALIYDDELTQEELSTAFWMNVGFSAALALVICLLSPLLTRLFGKPEVLPLLLALAPQLLLSAAAGIFAAVLNRRLALRGFAIRSLVATLLGGAAAIPLALQGAGVWALVAQQYVTGVVSVVVLAAGVGRDCLPRFSFSVPAARRMLGFGSDVALAALIRFVARRLDLATVGVYVAAGAVGQYFFAQRVALTLSRLTVQSVEVFALPVLARGRTEGRVTREGAIATMRWTGIVCFPLAGVAIGVADEGIPLVAGQKWADAAPIFSYLTLASCLFALGQSSAGQVLLANGQSRTYRNTSFLTAVSAFGCTWLGVVLGGAPMAAIGAALGAGLPVPLWLGLLCRSQGLHATALLSALARPLFASLLAWGLAFALVSPLANWPQLLAVPVRGVLALAAALVVLRRGLLEVLARRRPDPG